MPSKYPQSKDDTRQTLISAECEDIYLKQKENADKNQEHFVGLVTLPHSISRHFKSSIIFDKL